MKTVPRQDSGVVDWGVTSTLDPVDVVAAQVSAYNRRDAGAFSAWFAEDAVIARGDGLPVMAGRAVIEQMYGRLFAGSPNLRAEVLSRVAAGSWVVDEEVVTGMGGENAPTRVHALVAYRVQEGLIVRALMLG